MRHHKGKINWKVREKEKKVRKGAREEKICRKEERDSGRTEGDTLGPRMSIVRKANEGNEDWDG